MLWVQTLCSLRRFQVETQPLLNSSRPQFRRTLGQVKEENQIERYRSSQNRIAAKEVHLDLHRIAQPSEDVDVVPGFFVVAAWWVVVDSNLVKDVLVKIRVEFGLKDVFKRAQLGFFLGLE